MKEGNNQHQRQADDRVLPAKSVYVLMKGGCVSRNAFIAWYFRNLNEIISGRERKKSSDDEDYFEILSAILPDNELRGGCLSLAPSTEVIILSQKYSLVFLLHCNPSLASADISSNSPGVLFGKLYASLRTVLKSLAKSFCIPGTTERMAPEIVFSILVYTSVNTCIMKQVLVHGSLLSLDAIEDIMNRVERDLAVLETNLAAAFKRNVNSLSSLSDGDRGSQRDMSMSEIMITSFDRNFSVSSVATETEPTNQDADFQTEILMQLEKLDSASSHVSSSDFGLVAPEKFFYLMIKHCLLTLKQLTKGSFEGIVILTDGSLGMVDTITSETALQQLRNDRIAVSFVQIGTVPTFFGGLENSFYGHLPNTEFMQFIALATEGTYFNCVPRLSETGEPALNPIHRGILCRQLTRKDFPLSAVEPDVLGELGWRKQMCLDNWQTSLDTKFLMNGQVNATIPAIVSCRSKEGYILQRLKFTRDDDETKIEIVMSYPWRYSVYLNYRIQSIWTSPTARRQTQYDVFLEAPKAFIKDVIMFLARRNKFNHKKVMVERFTGFFKSIPQQDRMLTHVRHFASSHSYVALTEVLKSGVPLLIQNPTNSKEFVANPLVVNANASDFILFWKQLTNFDVLNSYRWFETQTFDVLLEHDEPMSRHVVSNASWLIHCRQSHEEFLKLLQQFTNFVLVEKTIYIGFIYGSPNDKMSPISYYVLKVEHKSCHCVVHIGYIGDKYISKTIEKINQLKQAILSLKLHRKTTMLPLQRTNPRRNQRVIANQRSPAHPRAARVRTLTNESLTDDLVGTAVDSPSSCCYIFNKSIDKAQILYEKVPQDFSQMEIIQTHDDKGQPFSATAIAFNIMTMTSNLLCHRRWIWSLRESDSAPLLVTPAVLDRILYNILRLRLDQGFHFIGCNLGIIQMAAELNMLVKGSSKKDDRRTSCLVQYIIFPPPPSSNKNERLHSELYVPVDDVVQLVTECWVEPQEGTVCEDLPTMKDFVGLQHHEILDAMYAADRRCISAFVTLENLVHLCTSLDTSVPVVTDLLSSAASLPNKDRCQVSQSQHCSLGLSSHSLSSPLPSAVSSTSHLAHSIEHVPFPFDPVALTTKCQQVELTFSLFIEADKVETPWNSPGIASIPTNLPSGPICPNTLLLSLFNNHLLTLHDRELTLKPQDCLELVKALKARERDFNLRPLPFGLNSEYYNGISADLFCTSKFGKGEDNKWGINNSSSCAGHTGSESSGRGSVSSSSSVPPRIGGNANKANSSKIPDFSKVPRWKCYLRLIKPSTPVSTSGSTGSTSNQHHHRHLQQQQQQRHHQQQQQQQRHQQQQQQQHPEQQNLIITLVPASYSDVQKLDEGDAPHMQSDGSSKEAEVLASDQADSRRGSGVGVVDSVVAAEHSVDDYGDGLVGDDGENFRPRSGSILMKDSKREKLMKSTSLDATLTSTKQNSSSKHQLSHKRSLGQEGVTFAAGSGGFDLRGEATFIPEHPPNYWNGPVVPVYVYNCSTTTFSDLLLNLRTNQKIPDLFEDLTFEEDMCSNSQVKSSILSQSPEKVTYLIDSSRKISECESSSSRERWRRAGEDLYKNQDDLKQHSTLISETYLRCFVMAMYESLRSGYSIGKRDVDAAIYSICEESRPIEIDLTDFLKNSCKQMQLLFETSPASAATAVTAAASTTAASTSGISCNSCSNPEYSIAEDGNHPGQSVMTFSKLLEGHCCDNYTTNHLIVKTRFLDIIHPYFHPIVAHPECLYCCETTKHNDTLVQESNKLKKNDEMSLLETAERLVSVQFGRLVGDNSSNLATECDSESNSIFHCSSVIAAKGAGSVTTMAASAAVASHLLQQQQKQQPHRNPQIGNALSSSGSMETDDSTRIEGALLRAKTSRPLFLHLVCSVRHQGKLCSFPLSSLPVCGADLRAVLPELDSGPLDGSTIKVTLDVHCLSLNANEDLRTLKGRPCYSRLTSINSSSIRSNQTSTDGEEDDEVESPDTSHHYDVSDDRTIPEDEDDDSYSHDEDDHDTTKQSVEESFYVDVSNQESSAVHVYNLECLPNNQQLLVMVCKTLVNWLLDDEIVSSLRSSFPVTDASLERVIGHIRSSEDRHPMCRIKEVPLQFVFGHEKSLPLFTEQLEKMKVGKHQLIRSGAYYYLCKPYTPEKPMDQAKSLTSALQDIHNSNQQALLVQHQSISVESTSHQKIEMVDDSCAIAEVDISEVHPKAAAAVISSVVSPMTVGTFSSDPNVQLTLSGSSLLKDHLLKKMASIGGIGTSTVDEDDDAGKSEHQLELPKELEAASVNLPDYKRAKHFFPTTSRVEVQGYGFTTAVSDASSCQSKFRCYASQTLMTESGGNPATPPALISHPFVTMSSSGDCYVKHVEGFSLDVGENKRVRPISGPAGLDGSNISYVKPASLLASCKLGDLDSCSSSVMGDSREDFDSFAPAPSTAAKVQLIKRAQSSTNFEKSCFFSMPGVITSRALLHQSASAAATTTTASAAQQSLDGMSRPSSLYRSRHTSGRDTPISAVDTSSITTGGYDADYSEIDEDGMVMTLDNLNTPSTVRMKLLVPNFWLILRVFHDKVVVYFHCREMKQSSINTSYELTFSEVVNNISKICHLVNQKLLLRDLLENRFCNPLLIAEADEDVRWSKDSRKIFGEDLHGRRKSYPCRFDYDTDSEDEDMASRNYLAASTEFNPGHFECPEQLTVTFELHPRLKGTATKAGTSAGMNALKAKLAQLEVTNRSNIYVLGNFNDAIFYARLSETTCDVSRTLCLQTLMKEDPKLTASHNPAELSVALKRKNKIEEELKQTPTSGMSDAESSGWASGQLVAGQQVPAKTSTSLLKTKEKITMTVYGVCPLVKEISVDLVSTMKKELDDVVLEALRLVFMRNQNIKLSVDDVQFIQKPDTPPLERLQFVFPNFALLTQHALGYYLRQNLQSYLIVPKYLEPSNPDNYFQQYPKVVIPPPPVPSNLAGAKSPPSDSVLPTVNAVVATAAASSSASSFSTKSQQLPSSSVATASAPAIAPATNQSQPTSDSDFFLYVRPQQDGNKGIACIHLSFVDSKGQPVHLLSSPKPNPMAYKEQFDPSLYDDLRNIVKYKPDPSSKSPGPVSIIQFSVWECGKIDLDSLSNMLQQSIRHAALDLVLEYRLLTAPICEVPGHYSKGVDSPLHSAPISPGFCVGESQIVGYPLREPRENQPVLSARPPADHSRNSSTFTDLGKLTGSYFTDVILSSRGHQGIERMTSVTFTCNMPDVEETTSNRLSRGTTFEMDEELLRKIRKYEEGTKGTLNPFFVTHIPNWLDFCHEHNVPSVSKHKYTLLKLFSVELLLQKFPALIDEQFSDVVVSFFREKSSSSNSCGALPVYEPFQYDKASVQKQDSMDDNTNNNNNNNSSNVSNNRVNHKCSSNFIVVVRNVNQWRQYLDWPLSSADQPFISSSHSRHHPPIQSPLPTPRTSKIISKRFPAMDEDLRMKSDIFSSLLRDAFIPRQCLVLLTCKDKEVTLYQYNRSQDNSMNLEKQLLRQVFWHNARSHVLTCIGVQKRGLYQEALFAEPPVDVFNKNEVNPFLINILADIDQLISHPFLPASINSQKMRNRSGSTALSKATAANPILAPVFPVLDSVYWDNPPLIPMHLDQSLLGKKDAVHKHGSQLRALDKQGNIKEEKYQNLCSIWNRFTVIPSQQITMTRDEVNTIKKSSRIIHQVMSPLLFSPIWQKESPLTTDSSFFIPTITAATKKNTSEGSSSNFEKKRSRHSSGSSVKSKRSDSMEFRARRLAGTLISGPGLTTVVGANQPATTTTSSGASIDLVLTKGAQPHPSLTHQVSAPVINTSHAQIEREFKSAWHQKICQYMGKLYISYLSPFHFFPLKVSQALSEKKDSMAAEQKQHRPQSHFDVSYMYRPLRGGLILIEVGFLTTHFYVTIYAFENPHVFPDPAAIDKMDILFTDECDKIKDAIHLNSFCHDFHLRAVQTFVNSYPDPEGTVLPIAYPVTRYLREVVSYFPYEPTYSWNYVHEESISVPCGANISRQLFDYMNKHLPNMKSVSMNPLMREEDLPSLREFALMCPLELTTLELKKHKVDLSELQVFDISLLLAMDDSPASPSDSDPTNPGLAQLPLKFWIVLTNRFQIYPKDSLVKKSATFLPEKPLDEPSNQSQSSPPQSPKLLSSLTTKQSANPSRVTFKNVNKSLEEKFRREQMDYLGYSNIHQIPLHVILQPVVTIARERIEKTVSEMSVSCYRDHLWMRLLVSDEESRRKRKTGEVEESKDPTMAKLSYFELQTLLDLVRRVDLRDFDSNLNPVTSSLAMGTVQQAVISLSKRFNTDSRYFKKPLDDHHSRQYLLILNPKALDFCIMIMVDDFMDIVEISLVLREESDLLNELPDVVKQQVDDFVSTCALQLWATFS